MKDLNKEYKIYAVDVEATGLLHHLVEQVPVAHGLHLVNHLCHRSSRASGCAYPGIEGAPALSRTQTMTQHPLMSPTLEQNEHACLAI